MEGEGEEVEVKEVEGMEVEGGRWRGEGEVEGMEVEVEGEVKEVEGMEVEGEGGWRGCCSTLYPTEGLAQTQLTVTRLPWDLRLQSLL